MDDVSSTVRWLEGTLLASVVFYFCVAWLTREFLITSRVMTTDPVRRYGHRLFGTLQA
jgi:hypothetical protein